MPTEQIVLTEIRPNGDKVLRSFPFDPKLTGAREAAGERLVLEMSGRHPKSALMWEVKPLKQGSFA